MFDSIKKLFGDKIKLPTLGGSSSGSSICGIDIGSGSIKVVQVKEEGGKIVLETYGALSLAPLAGGEVGKPARLSEQDTVKAITQVLQESH